MSEKQGLKTAKTFVIVFVVFLGLGALTYGAIASNAFKNTLSASIGEAKNPNMFAIGSWFRYDVKTSYVTYDWGKSYPKASNEIYFIATINGTTTAGNTTNGDKVIKEVFGDRQWYTWDIKAYWLSSNVEAVGLFTNVSMVGKAPSYHYGMSIIIDGLRYRKIDGATKFNDVRYARTIVRPQMLPIAGTSFNKSVLYADMYEYTYVKNFIATNNQSFTCKATYEKDTGILLDFSYRLQMNGYGAFVECALTGWKVNTLSLVTSTKPSLEITVEKITDGDSTYQYFIHFVLYQAKEIEFSLDSNNTAIVESIENNRTVKEYIPIRFLSDVTSPVKINVTARAYITPTYPSTDVSIIFVFTPVNVDPIVLPGVGIGTPTGVNATIVTNDTIKVEWNTVINATGYELLVNGTHFDFTNDTFYEFRASNTTEYGFSIVAFSAARNLMSNSSNESSVYFTTQNNAFAGDYGSVKTLETDIVTTWLLIATVVAGIIAAVFGINTLRCNYAMNNKKSVKACPAKYRGA